MRRVQSSASSRGLTSAVRTGKVLAGVVLAGREPRVALTGAEETAERGRGHGNPPPGRTGISQSADRRPSHPAHKIMQAVRYGECAESAQRVRDRLHDLHARPSAAPVRGRTPPTTRAGRRRAGRRDRRAARAPASGRRRSPSRAPSAPARRPARSRSPGSRASPCAPRAPPVRSAHARASRRIDSEASMATSPRVSHPGAGVDLEVAGDERALPPPCEDGERDEAREDRHLHEQVQPEEPRQPGERREVPRRVQRDGDGEPGERRADPDVAGAGCARPGRARSRSPR